MSRIELNDVLEATDLAEILAPTPRLKRLLTEPTVFDKARQQRLVGGFLRPRPLPEGIKPPPLRESVFGSTPLSGGVSSSRCGSCQVPLNRKERDRYRDYRGNCENCAKSQTCLGCGKAIIPFCNGRTDQPKSYCDRCQNNRRHHEPQKAGFPTAEQEFTSPTEEPLRFGGGGQEIEDHYQVDLVTTVDDPSNLVDLVEKNDLRAEILDLRSSTMTVPNFPAETKFHSDITDAERRNRVAQEFGIDPSTMTDENLEGLS